MFIALFCSCCVLAFLLGHYIGWRQGKDLMAIRCRGDIQRVRALEAEISALWGIKDKPPEDGWMEDDLDEDDLDDWRLEL